MTEQLKKYDDQIKKMSKEEKDLYIAKLLEQKEKAKEKAKEVANAKKEAGIKQLSIDLKESDINRFKILLQNTRANKTELFIKMLNIYERSLQQQQQQNQQNQQPKR